MTNLLRHRALVLLLALLLIGALGVSFGVGRLQAQGNPPAQPTAVAVLNIEDVLARLDEYNAFQLANKARTDALKAESADRQNAVQDMQNDLEFLEPGTEDYIKKESEIFDAIIELRTWQQVQEQRNILEVRSNLANLYRKIVQAGGAIADQRGIDIVVLDTRVPDFDRLNPEQLLNAIATRKVLYHNQGVDITDSVIERMNTAWNNR